MMRVRDWRTRLIEWGYAQIGKQFQWGKTDCVTLVRLGLQECFGRDVVPHIPTHGNARRARKLIKQFGSPRAILLSLGATEQPIAFARAGDMVVLSESDELAGVEAYGIWLDGACLLSGAEGVRLIPAANMPSDARVLSLWEIADNG